MKPITANKKIGIKFIVLFFLSILVLFMLLKYIDADRIKNLFLEANITYFMIAISVFCFTSYVSSIRFSTAIEISGFKLNILKSWSYILAVHPIHLFVPSNAGELWKSYLLKNEVKYSHTIGCIFIEKLFDVLTLSLLGIIGSLLLKNYTWMLLFILMLSTIIIFFMIAPSLNLNFEIKLIKKIMKILDAFDMLLKKPRIIFLLFIKSLIIWILFMLIIFILFNSINYKIYFPYIMVVYPISKIIGLIPLTIGGVGTRDTAFVYFFNTYDIPQEASLIVSLSYFVITYILPSVFGFPFTIYYLFKES